MSLDAAYAAHQQQHTSDTLATLYDALRRYAAKLAYGPDRHDLAEEAALRVWQSLDQFNGRSAFSSWAYRVIKSHLASAYRTSKLKPSAEPLDREDAHGLNVRVGYHRENDPASLPLNDEQKQILDVLLDTRSYAETAERIGITIKALYRRLDRIKARCHQQAGEKEAQFASN